jgi:hypothetical protein
MNSESTIRLFLSSLNLKYLVRMFAFFAGSCMVIRMRFRLKKFGIVPVRWIREVVYGGLVWNSFFNSMICEMFLLGCVTMVLKILGIFVCVSLAFGRELKLFQRFAYVNYFICGKFCFLRFTNHSTCNLGCVENNAVYCIYCGTVELSYILF